ncbi:NAD(P)H-dependent oxidoreductase [Gallaecimonas xiamenensis]|uniref:NAD(P)H dehydrogenase (Quinone) n=1 Tax=Gallaecimonas xiamenensis 3-C-1 TaxID=745411 RepID=K2JR52_9GAMM|nr:NAD(P)H-dependent oxidoreductase [Gallaecimonas xiamenensis]EKE77818.1 NAD(P)H dehydrogenase (quinone) [Gallaecimonas xiamenensis 3-C-1]
MKCLVVVCHPLQGSLCHYLANQTVAHLAAKGYQVEVLDLYEKGFDPRLTQQERQSYYQGQFDGRALAEELDQLTQAQSLVLIFPTWWFGFPAMLKGWFDRVWAPGHAYHHAADLGAIQPGLGNLKEVKVVTTLGSPWWVDTFVLWRPVKRVLKLALLGACAKGCKLDMLSFYKSESAAPARVERFVQKIKQRF